MHAAIDVDATRKLISNRSGRNNRISIKLIMRVSVGEHVSAHVSASVNLTISINK